MAKGSDSGVAIVGGILAATGIIILIAKPEILTNLLMGRSGGVGVGPGTTPVEEAPAGGEATAAPPGVSPVGKLPDSYKDMYYRLPTPEQDQKAKQKRNDPRIDIRVTPSNTIYQGTYFKMAAAGFLPFEHVNFYFSARALLMTGRYQFNTITTGGEIQHAVDKADAMGFAEVKMLAPDTVDGPADITAVGVESGRQINTTMYVLDTKRPKPIKRFRMSVAGEKFYVIATDPHVARGLIDMSQGQQTLAHIHGKIGYGPGKSGFNRPWHWHIVPHTLTLSESDTTTCNVRPSMIERDPGEFIRRNGFFCPLTSHVEAIEYV